MASISALHVFSKADYIHQQVTQSRLPFFDLQLIGLNNKNTSHLNAYSLSCDKTIDEVLYTDLLLIPDLEFDANTNLDKNKEFIPHLQRLYSNGAEIGSMCTGAFLLAAAGLLDGKQATTHWARANEFRNLFPQVDLKDHKIVIDNGGIYCCGGAMAYINLIIYIVEKYCGKETAIMTSKTLLIDFEKPAQHSYAVFIPQMAHSDEPIKQIQKYIHENPNDKLRVSDLVSMSNMSQATFNRRFKNATGESPVIYLQRVQIEKVKKLLESTNNTFEEITYMIGYSDKNSLREVFKKLTGLTPTAYRKKYTYLMT